MTDRMMSGEVRQARQRLEALGRWYATRAQFTPEELVERLVQADLELAHVARLARTDLLAEVSSRVGPLDRRWLRPLLDVPREQFVRSCDIGESARDTPLLLDDHGRATISAPHAYVLSFQVVGLEVGHSLLELGSGSGYGAALASAAVEDSGSVITLEIDGRLAERAKRLLAGRANVSAHCADAEVALEYFEVSDVVSVTFAVREVNPHWIDALRVGARMVVPVGDEQGQRLLCIQRTHEGVQWTDHGGVRYVPDRSPQQPTLGRTTG